MHRKLKVEIGDKYGKWAVLEGEKKVGSYWHVLCCCDCGKRRFVGIEYLIHGRTSSCKSCANRDRTKHGNSRKDKVSSEYISWHNMKVRCYNKNTKDYKNYGGRSIKVCERWRNSFENFLLDMGKKPTRLHTIDRKDNDGDYEPGNCRWATKKEQRNNQRAFDVSSIDVKELI